MTEHLLQPLGDHRGLQDRLPVGNLEGQVRGHGRLRYADRLRRPRWRNGQP
jgi:hypothetical protein